MFKTKLNMVYIEKRNNNRAVTVTNIRWIFMRSLGKGTIYLNSNRDHLFEGIINTHRQNSRETQMRTTILWAVEEDEPYM